MKTRNLLFALFAFIVTVGALLALDLSNRGMFWQFAWSVTGEEDPIGQVRGVAQWTASQFRPQPETAPLVPIDHTHVSPYGINTFLQQEVEPEKIERQLQMISEAGFAWIRQQFEWAELEVDGPGQFTDSRNDIDGDGVPDTVDAWAKYDRIVDLAEQYDIRIQARLDNPPTWTHADPSIGDFAPPDNLQDFADFAAAVAERYQGRIQYYQVWNEPNIYPEWGNQPVDPEGYTDLLCRTYDALKTADPNAVVITGALAPTIELGTLRPDGGNNLMDLIFLQRMYDAGAADCFDVLSVQAYGLFSGPTDRRMRPTTINIARNQYIRDLMVANGDAHKSIWISEAAWNSVPTVEERPDIVGIREQYGQVTQEQAAEYMPLLYERAQEEWPWVGVINYWFFTLPSDDRSNEPFYYFRMAEPDYSPEKPSFTPLPVYDAMQQHITDEVPILYDGVHQAEHWAVRHWIGQEEVDPTPVTAEGAQFDTAIEVSMMEVIAHGTRMTLRWRGDPPEVRLCDGTRIDTGTEHRDEWTTTVLTETTLATNKTFSILAEGDTQFDSFVVVDRSVQNAFPYAALGVGALLMFGVAVGVGVRGQR